MLKLNMLDKTILGFILLFLLIRLPFVVIPVAILFYVGRRMIQVEKQQEEQKKKEEREDELLSQIRELQERVKNLEKE